jgi:hypothetical protein
MRKAKFRVGQVVWYHVRNDYWALKKLRAIKYFRGEGYGYQFEDSLDEGFREEERMRPLTLREIGPRKRRKS